MQRWRYLGLLMLIMAMVLLITIAGLAQGTTPTPDVPEQPEPMATATMEASEEVTTSLTATTEVTSTTEVATALAIAPEVTLSVSPALTISLPLAVGSELAVTEVLTVGATISPTLDQDLTDSGAITEAVTVSIEPGIELTVYNQNLGLVKEIRTIELDSGRNEFRYSDVASAIEPTSVQVTSLSDPGGLVVLEQNFEYDIVSSRKLLQKYIDQEIALTTKEGTVYSGTLLSGADDIILATGDGITIVRLDQVQELSFPELPEGLITKPTLVWLLDAAQAGAQDVQVTYLTAGISWRADYNILLAADAGQLSMTGWVSLYNESGATYEDAKLKLVAGDINRVSQQDALLLAEKAAELRSVGAPAVEERGFFEYHIYQVQRPVTVRDRQTKQIEFVTAPAVRTAKVFVYEASPKAFVTRGSALTDPNYGTLADGKVQVHLEFDNKQESGLGLPLPKGTVRVYQQDIDGGAELIGEDSISHVPRGEAVSLYLGDAFDIVGERIQTDFVKLGERSLEESYQITLRNHKQEDVIVRVVEQLFRAQDAMVIESSMDYEMPNATTLEYAVPVAADAQAVLSYTVRYKW